MNRSLTNLLASLTIGFTAVLSGCAAEGLDSFSDSSDSVSESAFESASKDPSGFEAAEDDGSENERRRRPAARTTAAFAGYSLYVDPVSNPADQADEWRTSRPDDAALMDVLAAQPLAVWIGDWTWDVTGTVDDVITEGGSQLRTLVVYNIPYRDCGAWSAGGAADVASYGTFISQVAAGIDGRKVIVVLEPDGLPLQRCLTAAQSTERLALMASAVTTLTAAGASVYLDAGDSNWIGATEMAGYLAAANVAGAAGISLNVSHTEHESNEIAFAEEIRAILGTGVHYVIDSGRAGLGPTSDNEWCNPLGRAIGERPSLTTGTTGLDAYLWIKPPGESDGSCNGGPVAGAWWADYALELAELGA